MTRKTKTTYSTIIEVGGKVYEKTVCSTESINEVMDGLVRYVQQEGINQLGECNVRVAHKN